MYETLFLGKELIQLDKVDSTNTYLKNILSTSKNKIEGVTVAAHQQVSGKGQMGNVWESEKGMNLTFSVLLKPKLKVADQFIISKVIALGIVSFLDNIGVEAVKIKWPNDIYVGTDKIAGVLIENTIKSNQIENCIVGIGLNVNQLVFSEVVKNGTSLKTLLGKEFSIEDVLQQLLFFIEKSYLLLKSNKTKKIDELYLKKLHQFNEDHFYLIGDEKVEAKIVGISANGMLQLSIQENIKAFDLKEVKFL